MLCVSIAMLTKPLWVTKAVTSTDVQVPESDEGAEPTVVPATGAFVYVIVASPHVLSETVKTL